MKAPVWLFVHLCAVQPHPAPCSPSADHPWLPCEVCTVQASIRGVSECLWQCAPNDAVLALACWRLMLTALMGWPLFLLEPSASCLIFACLCAGWVRQQPWQTLRCGQRTCTMLPQRLQQMPLQQMPLHRLRVRLSHRPPPHCSSSLPLLAAPVPQGLPHRLPPLWPLLLQRQHPRRHRHPQLEHPPCRLRCLPCPVRQLHPQVPLSMPAAPRTRRIRAAALLPGSCFRRYWPASPAHIFVAPFFRAGPILPFIKHSPRSTVFSLGTSSNFCFNLPALCPTHPPPLSLCLSAPPYLRTPTDQSPAFLSTDMPSPASLAATLGPLRRTPDASHEATPAHSRTHSSW